MSDKRKALIGAMKLLWLIAALCIAYVFFSSLGPNSKSLEALPSIDVRDLSAGSFKYVNLGPVSPRPFQVSVLFIRSRDKHLFAYYILSRDGVTVVPIEGPWRPGPECAHFQPNFETAEISCIDNPPVDESVNKHRWSLLGINLSHSAPDLLRVKGKEESGSFVLYKQGF